MWSTRKHKAGAHGQAHAPSVVAAGTLIHGAVLVISFAALAISVPTRYFTGTPRGKERRKGETKGFRSTRNTRNKQMDTQIVKKRRAPFFVGCLGRSPKQNRRETVAAASTRVVFRQPHGIETPPPPPRKEPGKS